MPRLDNAPVLEGWLTLPMAAARLGISKQGIHWLAQRGHITTLCKLPGDRTIYLMREAELPQMERHRQGYLRREQPEADQEADQAEQEAVAVAQAS